MGKKLGIIILCFALCFAMFPAFPAGTDVLAAEGEAEELLLPEEPAAEEELTVDAGEIALSAEEEADEIVLSAEEEADEIVLSAEEEESEEALSAKETAPLDFAADSSSRSGDGWSWDQDTATLTVTDLNLNLSDYEEDYKAAITLPDAASSGTDGPDFTTVVLAGDSVFSVRGKTEGGEYRLGILANGNLKITGNGALTLNADAGANGIEAEGSLFVGYGDDPKSGTRIAVNAMDFAIASVKDLSIEGAYIKAEIEGTNEDPNAAKIALIGENQGREEYGVYIADAILEIGTNGPGTTGVMAYDGALFITESTYSQTAVSGLEGVGGIVNYNGDVFIAYTELDIDLGAEKDMGDVLISAGRYSQDHPAEKPCVQISDSTLNAKVAGEGIFAFFGGAEIADSTINIDSIGHAVRTGSGGLTVSGSELYLKNTGDYYSGAVNAAGPVTISSSKAYLAGEGDRSFGLTTGSQVTILGNDTFVDLAGTLAALEIHSNTTVTEAPFMLLDSLKVIEGGTMQYVDYEDVGADDMTRAFSFSEGTLEVETTTLKNASTHVLIGNPEGLLITQQPEDVVVSYPEGASFHVGVLAPENVASYQWILTDVTGKDFVLDGTSAVTDTLVIPSTEQENNILTFRCEITDKDGNKAVTRDATLEADNVEEDKTVLYAGNYAIEPGEELDLADTSLGSGTVSLDETGTEVTLDNVHLDNSVNVFDTTLSPSMGITLSRHMNTEEDYTVFLKGDNRLVNTFYQPSSNGSGMTFDFLFWGTDATRPEIMIDGQTYDGTLFVSGGSNAIRAYGDLVISADITMETNGYYFMDGIVCDSLIVGPDQTLDLTVNGAGFSVTKGLTIESDAEVAIHMTPPYVSGGATYKGAIFAGGGSLDIKMGAELSIDCHATKENGATIGGCAGIMLVNGATMTADGSTITISMEADPDPDPGEFPYAAGFIGISGGDDSDITLLDTDLDVNIDSETIYGAFGVYSYGSVTLESCIASVDVAASGPVYGLAPEGDLSVSKSQLDVTSRYYGEDGLSYALLGDNVSLSIDDPTCYINADATNDDGIAVLANTDEGGDEPKTYEAGYTPKRLILEGIGKCLTPKDAQISLTSIEGSMNPYVYCETYYDPADTSKPANKVELGVEGLEIAVQPASAEVNYPDGVSFHVEAAHPENVASYQWELYDSVKTMILDGTSATTDTLVIPATEQDGEFSYRCLITGKDGSAAYSDYADLTILNSEEDKPVLYVGNYAVEPGEVLDLTDTTAGSGKISFDASGTDITFDNIKYDNTVMPFDHDASPATGIELTAREVEADVITVHVKGENEIVNTFYQEEYDLAGMDLAFNVYGKEEDVYPKVRIEGDSLKAAGGTYLLHSSGTVELALKVTQETIEDHSSNGFYIENGGLTLEEGADVLLNVNGTAVFIGPMGGEVQPDNNLVMEAGAKMTVNADIPKPAVDAAGGYNDVSMAAVYTGNAIDISGAELDIHFTPDFSKIAGKAAIDEITGLQTEMGAITITDAVVKVLLEPTGQDGEIYTFVGIGNGQDNSIDISGSDVTVKMTDAEAATAFGMYAAMEIVIAQDSKADVAVNGGSLSQGLYADDMITIADSKAYVVADGMFSALKVGISAPDITFDISEEAHEITAEAAEGYAIAALTGISSKQAVYTAGYEPAHIHLLSKAEITLPEAGEINLYGYLSDEGPKYTNMETVYDPADTSKPAEKAVIAKSRKEDISGAKITLSSTSMTYTGKALKPAVKSVVLNGKTLTEGTDYTVSYLNNTKVGTATVVIKGTGNYRGTAEKNFTIKDRAIKGLSLPAALEIAAEASYRLTPTFTPENTSQTGLKWKSSDTAVATVDSRGNVTGLTRGTAKITAVSKADSSIKATCTVTVLFKDATRENVSAGMFKAIYWAADNKITGEKVVFGTNDSMTRGQFVRFLYRYAGSPKVNKDMIKKYGSKFTDVGSKYTHYNAIVWAVSKGLIDGYSNGTFKPNGTLTRSNVATILWKYAGKPSVKNAKNPFTDVPNSVAIAWGKSKNIFKGTSFRPKEKCLRGDFALFLYRYDKSK